MKILVLSSTPWSNTNSFGNSYSNIFEGIENIQDIEIANIACKPGMPTSYLVKRYFQISEKRLIRNLRNKKIPSGEEIDLTEQKVTISNTEEVKARAFGQKHRLQILFWMRDLLWKIGRWKSPQFLEFIDSFSPDVIFLPVYFSSYLNDMALFLKTYTGKPMIGYVSDDCYTLKQFSLSPLYWIDRLYKRQKVKKTINQCEVLYVISDVQKEEYEKVFRPPCKILTKCADFSDEKKPAFKEPDEVLRMVYAGNVGRGRYEILAELAKNVKQINKEKKKIELDIYTLTPLRKKQVEALSGEDVHLHPPVSYEEIRRIQSNADILLHVDGFTLQSKLYAHQSFSTKIVDYLEMNRCVFAIGSDYCASIRYYLRHGCGVVATRRKDIRVKLEHICHHPEELTIYAQKGWETGKKYHSKDQIQHMVAQDIQNVLKGNMWQPSK